MKAIFSFIIILTILTIEAPAQNFSWQQTNGPAGGYVRALVRNSNGTMFAGTDAGVYKSTNNGDSWLLSNGAIGNSYIYSMAVSPNGTIFAGTFYNKIFRSTDEGNSWTQVGFNVYFIIDAMAVKPDGTVFAGTEESDGSGNGSVYRSTDNGNTWTEVNNGLPNSNSLVRQIRVDENGSVFAATFNGLYKSTNDGASWTQLTNGIWITLISSIAVNSLNNYFYASGSNLSGTMVGVFRSTDGGNTFTQLSFPDIWAPTIDVSPAGHFFAAVTGFIPTLNFGIYRSTDDGVTFVKIDSSLSVKNFAFGTTDQIFAGTNLGFHLSSDDGNNWQLKVSGMTGLKTYVLAADNVNNIYAGTGNGPYRSTDFGESWERLGDIVQLRATQSMVTTSNGYIFIINDNGGVFRSTDTGNNWTQLSVGAALGVLFAASNDYLFIGPPFQGVLRSTDYGNTWTPRNTGLPANSDIQAFADDPSGKIYAGASYGIWQSTINGDLWMPYSTYNGYLDLMAANASGDLFWAHSDAFSNENDFYRSTDNGSTYTQLTVVSGNVGVVSDILISPDQNVFVAVTDNIVGGVYRSTNNGDTFEQVNDGLTEKLLTSLAIDAQEHLLAGTTRGVFRSIQIVPVELVSFSAEVIEDNVTLKWITATEKNNSGFEIQRKFNNPDWGKIGFVEGHGTTTEPKTYSFIDYDVLAGKYSYRLKQIDLDGTFEYSNEFEVEVSLPQEFLLSQNYPNPFNPGTKISFAIPSQEFVTIKVYDILGREVATLVNDYKTAGTYAVEFNAARFASGVYFYQMQAGNFIETKKMVLLK